MATSNEDPPLSNIFSTCVEVSARKFRALEGVGSAKSFELIVEYVRQVKLEAKFEPEHTRQKEVFTGRDNVNVGTHITSPKTEPGEEGGANQKMWRGGIVQMVLCISHIVRLTAGPPT